MRPWRCPVRRGRYEKGIPLPASVGQDQSGPGGGICGGAHLGSHPVPGPGGRANLFYNYFISAPITVSFILFIMSFSMGANNLNISPHSGRAAAGLLLGPSAGPGALCRDQLGHPAADVGGAQGAPVDRSLGWDLSLLGGWPLWVYPWCAGQSWPLGPSVVC